MVAQTTEGNMAAEASDSVFVSSFHPPDGWGPAGKIGFVPPQAIEQTNVTVPGS
jgi:hypothetical protein